MDTRPLPSPCHWTRLPLWLKKRTNVSVPDVAEKFFRPKKWWQPLDIITGIVSDVAFVVNHWILHLFVMVLMTRFIVGCVMDVLGNKPLVLIILLYVYFFKP